MLDNLGNKLLTFVADVIQKQNYGTQQLYMGFDKISTLTQDTYKNKTSNDTNQQHLPIHHIKQLNDKTQTSNQINNQQTDKYIDPNNKKLQQIKIIKKENRTGARGTPIQGFKLTQMNSQNEQNDLPKPKISIQGAQKQLKNDNIKTTHKSINYQQLKQKIQSSVISKMATNPSNPQQLPQIKIIKPDQSKSMHLGKNNQTPYKISNLRLKKIIGSDSNKMRKSIKTEVNLSNNNQDQDMSMDLQVEDERFQKFNKKYGKNIQINSNVVNYCQSLNQSKIIGQRTQKQKNKIKDRALKQLAQQKKDEKNTIKKSKLSKKIKTELNYQDHFKIEQETRSQLKVVYQKKYKLQQKLKKLNRQLQKLSAQKNQKVQMGLYDRLNYSIQTVKHMNPEISQYSTPMHRRHISNKFNSFDLIEKRSYRNHLKQIENGKKAIQFVQKISKQSLKRKLEKQNKINKDIIQRVKDHVSINCSRIRCQAQAFQGQTRKYKNQINSRIIKNSNFQHK